MFFFHLFCCIFGFQGILLLVFYNEALMSSLVYLYVYLLYTHSWWKTTNIFCHILCWISMLKEFLSIVLIENSLVGVHVFLQLTKNNSLLKFVSNFPFNFRLICTLDLCQYLFNPLPKSAVHFSHNIGKDVWSELTPCKFYAPKSCQLPLNLNIL